MLKEPDWMKCKFPESVFGRGRLQCIFSPEVLHEIPLVVTLECLLSPKAWIVLTVVRVPELLLTYLMPMPKTTRAQQRP